MEVSSLDCTVRFGPMSCPFCDKAYKSVRGIKRHLTSCRRDDAGPTKPRFPRASSWPGGRRRLDGFGSRGFVVAKVAADGCTGLKRKANEAGAEEIPLVESRPAAPPRLSSSQNPSSRPMGTKGKNVA